MSESGSESYNSKAGKPEGEEKANPFQEHMTMAGEYISQHVRRKPTADKVQKRGHDGRPFFRKKGNK